jgi:hypothetical protein
LIITAEQIAALCRFNRSFNVIYISLTESGENVTFRATLKAGKNEIEKVFTLDTKGQLVKNENSQTDIENTA